MKTVTFDETQWQLVPKEPTEVMRLAGVEAGVASKTGWCPVAYRAMLANAPQPPVAQVDERKTVWMPDYYASSVDLPDGAKWAVRHCRGEHIVAITTTQKWAETIALCLDKEAERRASLASQPAALTPTAEQAPVRSDEHRRDAEHQACLLALTESVGGGLTFTRDDDGKLIAITKTDDEHKIIDCLWCLKGHDVAMSDNQESSK